MLTELVVGLLVVVCMCVVGWHIRRRPSVPHAWLPRELRAARLVYAERLFRADGPVVVTARVDRVYREGSGDLTLVELKTRFKDRVYLSDIVELSVQRYVFAAQTGEHVRTTGYVFVQIPGGPRRRTAHRVDLLTSAQVETLIARREALLMGTVDARRACSPALCACCTFITPCRSAGGRVL